MTSAALRTSGRSTLLGYAVLRANFSHNAPSYVDNFTPFVLDVLRDSFPLPLDEGEVGERVRERFGLTLPDRVAGLLLKRSVKRGDAERIGRDGFLVAEKARASDSSLSATMAAFIAQQGELMQSFRDFVSESYASSVPLIDRDPGFHVHAFIERFAAPLLRRAVSGQTTEPEGWSELQGVDYLVAKFILLIADSNARLFSYVVDAVKGAVLTSVLDVGPGDLRQKLNDLTLILDTPLLLSALGYHGEIRQRAMRQLLDLARALSARVAYFDHTEREVAGVLESAAHALSRPGRSPMRDVDVHFLQMEVTAADVVVMQSRLRGNLEDMGMRPISRPDTQYRYGLDEAELEGLLHRYLPTQRDASRLFDVDSISAVHLLRRGASSNNFESCQYVFVSSNFGLLQAADAMASEKHGWPLVMLDSDVAALLWVRQPGAAEDLPREQLLAAVHAGMQPDGHLWMKYVAEIERLELRGEVDASEALILKATPEARGALMDITLGDVKMADETSLGRVVDRVRASLAEPFRVDADLAKRQRDAAIAEAGEIRRGLDEARMVIEQSALRLDQSELEAAKQREAAEQEFAAKLGEVAEALGEIREREAEYRRKVHKNSLKMARVRLNLLIGGPATLLVLAGVLGLLAPSWVASLPLPVGIVAGLAGVVGLAFTLLRGSFGGDLRTWLAPFEERMARRIEERILARAGLTMANH